MDFDVRILFDGECPLCAREIRLLERLDRGRGRLQFEDIASPEFDATRYGLDQQTVMARIHGILPDGGVVEGIELFRRAYGAVGLGWLMAPARLPLIGRLYEAAYRWFARNRLRLTGRGDACASGACELPAQSATRPTSPAKPSEAAG